MTFNVNAQVSRNLLNNFNYEKNCIPFIKLFFIKEIKIININNIISGDNKDKIEKKKLMLSYFSETTYKADK